MTDKARIKVALVTRDPSFWNGTMTEGLFCSTGLQVMAEDQTDI